MQKLPKAPDSKWGDACAKKGTVPAKRRDSLSLQRNPSDEKVVFFFYPATKKIVHLFTKSLGLRMGVVSATSEPTRRNKQHKKNTGHNHTELRLTYHHRRLIYFNISFGRNDCNQIVQEDISRYRVAIWKPKRNKVEIHKISSLSAFLLLQAS